MADTAAAARQPHEEVIEFEVVDAAAAPGEYGSADDPSPYIHLESPADDVAALRGRDDIVIAERQISVSVTYPLSAWSTFTLRADAPGGFTRGGLALKISKLYKKIYAEERRTGKYGIWGHDLGDLALHTVSRSSPGAAFDLGIDS